MIHLILRMVRDADSRLPPRRNVPVAALRMAGSDEGTVASRCCDIFARAQALQSFVAMFLCTAGSHTVHLAAPRVALVSWVPSVVVSAYVESDIARDDAPGAGSTFTRQRHPIAIPKSTHHFLHRPFIFHRPSTGPGRCTGCSPPTSPRGDPCDDRVEAVAPEMVITCAERNRCLRLKFRRCRCCRHKTA